MKITGQIVKKCHPMHKWNRNVLILYHWTFCRNALSGKKKKSGAFEKDIFQLKGKIISYEMNEHHIKIRKKQRNK